MEIVATMVEIKSCDGEALRILQQEKESRVKDHEAYDDRVAGLWKKVNEYLQQTLTKVYGAFDQAVGQVETLCLDISISCLQLDSFKVVQDKAFVEDLDATSQAGEVCLSFVFMIMLIGCYALMFPCYLHEQ